MYKNELLYILSSKKKERESALGLAPLFGEKND